MGEKKQQKKKYNISLSLIYSEIFINIDYDKASAEK